MHTEESLMRLVNEALNTAEKAEADHCSALGRDLQQSNANAREAEAALRLAIREVLAENKRVADDLYFQCCITKELLPYQERAVKAEAECERLREDLRGLEEVRREQAAGRDYWSAECERNRKDSERYRWLRDLPEGHPSNWISEAPGDMWDAAIDAAMRSGDIR